MIAELLLAAQVVAVDPSAWIRMDGGVTITPTRTPTATRTRTRTPRLVMIPAYTRTPGIAIVTPYPWPTPVALEVDVNTTPHAGFTPNIVVAPYPCSTPGYFDYGGQSCSAFVPLTPGIRARKKYGNGTFSNVGLLVTETLMTPTRTPAPPTNTRTRTWTATALTRTPTPPGPTPVPDLCAGWPPYVTCTPTPRGLRSPTPSARTATPSPTSTPARFSIGVTWTKPDGSTGSGSASCSTSAGSGSDFSSGFYFFSPSNTELYVSVLPSACSINGHIWVKAMGATNVDVQIGITDRQTGASWSYHYDPKAPGAPPVFPTQIDTGAMPCQ